MSQALIKKPKIKNSHRLLTIDSGFLISEERTLELSVSSNLPYERGYYREILQHDLESVNLSRFNNSANVLYNHNRDDYIGVVESSWIADGKLYARMRFDTHDLAQKIMNSVENETLKNVSIGYLIEDYNLKELEDDITEVSVTRWTPFEFSFVTVPADPSVGVGRNFYDFLDKKEKIEQEYANALNLTDNLRHTQALTKKDMNQTVVVDEHNIKQEERERVQGILALAQKHGHPEIAERAINEDLTIVSARSLYLDKVSQIKDEPNPVAAGINPVGMSNKERRKYSAIKAAGYAAGIIKADKVGLELEVSAEIEKRSGKAPKKIYLDQSELVSFRAPYETGVPAAAGNLIETEYLGQRFVDQLYNLSAFLEMGVTYLRDLTGNIEIPRESTYTTGYWVGEKLTIPEDEGTFDKIFLSPHKLAILTRITFEMLEQNENPDIERLFRARLIRGLALELDRAIGFGSGIGSEPLGIASHPETQSIVLGVNGAPLDKNSLVQMQTELAAANALTDGSSGYVFNSRTRGKLMTTLDHPTGGGSWLYQSTGGNTGMVEGYRARVSNQIPNNLIKGTANNLTAAFFGDFSNVLLALWSGMDVMANPYSEFSEAIIQVRAMQLVDINLTRGDYFCVATDVQNN